MLLLRISLVLAILAGIGVIALNMAVLKPQVEGIIQTRDYNKKEWDKTESARKQVALKLKESETELKSTKTDLDSTKGQLSDATAKLAEQTKLAADRAATIAKLTADLKAAK